MLKLLTLIALTSLFLIGKLQSGSSSSTTFKCGASETCRIGDYCVEPSKNIRIETKYNLPPSPFCISPADFYTAMYYDNNTVVQIYPLIFDYYVLPCEKNCVRNTVSSLHQCIYLSRYYEKDF